MQGCPCDILLGWRRPHSGGWEAEKGSEEVQDPQVIDIDFQNRLFRRLIISRSYLAASIPPALFSCRNHPILDLSYTQFQSSSVSVTPLVPAHLLFHMFSCCLWSWFKFKFKPRSRLQDSSAAPHVFLLSLVLIHLFMPDYACKIRLPLHMFSRRRLVSISPPNHACKIRQERHSNSYHCTMTALRQ